MRRSTLLWLWVAACGTDTSETPPVPTAASIQAQILGPSCGLSSSCHAGNGGKAKLDLSSLAATCSALAAPSCEFPDKRRTTFLLEKLSCGDEGCAGVPDPACGVGTANARMPFAGLELDAASKTALEAWINAGLPGCSPQ